MSQEATDKEEETVYAPMPWVRGREPLASIVDTWIEAVNSTHLYKVGLWVPRAWALSGNGKHDNCWKLDKVLETGASLVLSASAC